MRARITPSIGLALALVIAAVLYWPGLSGSYLFDDYPNIVNNTDLQINTLNSSSVARAALSSPSSEFKRPLASLSFAANFFLTGLDPFWMKFTNLLIHILNGLLVYALALTLIRISPKSKLANTERDPRWIALWIAAAWLLLPINLTSVLYVVQRMESLSNLFVMLGLLGYINGRLRMQRDGRGLITATVSLLLATSLGLMSKETAVMTPLYAALIEWALLGARSADNRRDLRIIGLFVVVLVAPLIIGLIWQLPKLLNSGAWANRNFDLSQRLMTEARVVVDYIFWTLLPTPKALAFYHDDYRVSTGWLSPWSTLLCTIIISSLIVIAISLRKRAPLVTLGLALFLGAQILTGTILPLELVYEHRNYFASFGLLLALIPLLLASAAYIPARNTRMLMLGVLMSLWAVQTLSTAAAWGSPLTLSRTLAERAPNSPRAQYGLGHTYIVLSKYNPKSPFTAAAYAPLEKAMLLPDASILPEQALIMMNARMNQPIKQEWWDSLIGKLKAHKPGAQDEGSLEALAKCMHQKKCVLDRDQMLQAFLAGLSYPNSSARLLSIYGTYAWNVMGDRALAQNVLAEAVRSDPKQPTYRIALVKMLLLQNQVTDADQHLAILAKINIGGRFDAELSELNALKSKATH